MLLLSLLLLAAALVPMRAHAVTQPSWQDMPRACLPSRAEKWVEGRVEAQQVLPVAMTDGQRRHHFGIKQGMPGELAVETPAMPVRPVHHGRDGEYFSFVFQCAAYPT